MNASSARWQVAGRAIAVTHLEKVYWPDDGITKGEMLRYYRTMAPTMLPYCLDRPLTLRVYPEGLRGASYYRREQPRNAPAWLRSATYQPETSEHAIQVPLADDAAGLVWLANQGSIEFHLWTARLPDLSEPDQAVFDLDPGEQATFAEVLQAALRVREALERLGLRAYAKTTGGQGLHVYLPLAPGHTYAAVRAWVKGVAEQLAAAHPELIAVAHGATHQGSRVTVDYAQNSVGRNTAAPYTLRARAHAPVSAPLSWDEVAAGQIRPTDLTLHTVPERVEQIGDLFAPVLQADQRLPD